MVYGSNAIGINFAHVLIDELYKAVAMGKHNEPNILAGYLYKYCVFICITTTFASLVVW